jgi:hypothetical protein
MGDLVIAILVLGIMASTLAFILWYSNKTRQRMIDEMEENQVDWEADLDAQYEHKDAEVEKAPQPGPKPIEAVEPAKKATITDIMEVLEKAAEVAETVEVHQPPKKKRRGRPKAKKNS